MGYSHLLVRPDPLDCGGPGLDVKRGLKGFPPLVPINRYSVLVDYVIGSGRSIKDFIFPVTRISQNPVITI